MVMDREYADREVEKAKKMVTQYKEKATQYQDLASGAAIAKDFVMAHRYNQLSTGATNSMHYWLGHMNAFQGLAAQLGFMEIVEEELEEEGSCP